MADTKEQLGRAGASNDGQARAISLVGDSPELIAFSLLRSIAQMEQKPSGQRDREWLLDSYAECLSAVRGERPAASSKKTATARPRK
jgi:hypothetical protein